MFFNNSIEDSISELVAEEFCSSSVEQALNDIGLGACIEFHAPVSALRLLLVYSNSEYSFTAIELAWLKKADTVFSYYIGDETVCFFVEMNCSVDEYYSSCAAIIKLFNVAFLTNNIFVFRISNNIAFGSVRDADNHVPNNFVVTGLINDNNLDLYGELLYELPTTALSDLPGLLIDNSPESLFVEYNYETVKDDPDYSSFIRRLEHLYGIDTHEGRSFYHSHYNCQSQKHPMQLAYIIACEELKNVAESTTYSSYEVLNAAQKAENDIKHETSSPKDSELELLDDAALRFSDEAFKDAEQMLREINEIETERNDTTS